MALCGRECLAVTKEERYIKDFLLILVLAFFAGLLSLMGGIFGLLAFAAVVIAALFAVLMKLWFRLEAVSEQLDRLLKEKYGDEIHPGHSS